MDFSSMHRPLVAAAALLCVCVPAFPRQAPAICGTHREKWREELYLHRRAERVRLARLKYAPLAAQQRPAAHDIGNIAILSDGDGVVARRNDFNLVYETLSFLPATPEAARYRFTVRENTYDDAAAAAGTALAGLADDDSREVVLPFAFPFFGSRYQRVWVNSDGNLTFRSPDSASTDRSLGRLTAGPPRIAGLFRDLDPSKSSQGVRVLAQAERVAISWVSVPEYQESGVGARQTFQIRLYPDGRIDAAYYDVNTSGAVVGIAPGNLEGSTSVVSFAAGGSAEYSAAVAEVFRATTEVDVVRTAQKFYETHEDAYDYLVIFNNLGISAGESAVAFESTVRNSRSGYGDIPIDVGLEFGSSYRLQAIQNMGPLGQYPKDPNGIVAARSTSRDTPLTVLAHEAGHLFLAYASVRDQDDPQARPMLGYQNAHWTFAFNSEASLLEGNRIQDNGPNASPRFYTTATVEGFAPLDQYLMGLRPPEEVLPTFLVTGVSPAYRFRPPQPGVGLDGGRRDIQLQEIIDAEGRRTPDSTVAQRYFRFAFILITAGGGDPSAGELAQVETYRTEFEKYYRRATSERAWADATLKRSLRLSVFPAAGVLEGGSAPATVSLAKPAPADLTVMFKTQTGAAGVPASVIIPAGAVTASFTIRGVRAGVEELTAEPSDGGYETAHARIQVLNGAAGVQIVAEPSQGAVVARVTDINNLPYPGVVVRAASVDGIATATTDSSGRATFAWNGEGRLSLSAEGVAGGVVLGAAGKPALEGSGVVNAASGSPGLTPGGLASIYGSNLAGGAILAAGTHWPEELAGVRVVVAGRIAPLLYVSDRQINFLAPSDLAEGVVTLTVTTPAGASPPVEVRVSAFSPGIFAVANAGTVHTTLEEPARREGYLEIYATGLGPVRASASGLRESLAQPEVSIGNATATVSYSGLAPGFLGLYQVNVQVPKEAGSGLQPLRLAVGAAVSNAVTVRIE